MPQSAIQQLAITAGGVRLVGDLNVPTGAAGLVIFAHGSGSSRLSTRNQFVARQLNNGGLATLLFDLLTAAEEAVDAYSREHRFNIPLLAERLVATVDWAGTQTSVAAMRIGLFGASTGAAAALIAAAQRPGEVGAVVSRGGRPDLARDALPQVQAPTLLIVGGDDTEVLQLNQQAAANMTAMHRIAIVPGATHLFEEPGTLERVADLARDWFTTHLSRSPDRI